MSIHTQVTPTPRPAVDDTKGSTHYPQQIPKSSRTRSPVVRPRRGFGRFLYQPGLILSALFVLLVLGWALHPSMFANTNPLRSIASPLQPPSTEHWFGTDYLGRDVYARVVHGTSLSLQAVVIAVATALVIGSAVGLIAGIVGGWLDDVIMRIVDVLLAVPGILLALAIVAALGFGTLNVAIAVGVSSATGFARVMRAEVLRIRTSAFVEAGAALGRRWSSNVARHVLPNSVGPVAVLAALELGTAVLAVSSLSFLGFGAKPPAPEWGSLISDGRNYLATSWWLTIMPGTVVVAFVLATNRLARSLERSDETQ
ncbi:ABC transporter permease (plasmid) [Rhodococcus globerulus]|uniref:ABC transporter permease n=1 Tax=Rhodococcus globerulus TaxID=33008 RepID=UPI0039ED3CEC